MSCFHVLFPFDRIAFYSKGDFDKDFYFSLFRGIFLEPFQISVMEPFLLK